MYQVRRNRDARSALEECILHNHRLFQRGYGAVQDKYYAPYFTIIQSSGYGKTRLAIQMAEKFFCFYICLRAVDSTGKPPRTSTVADSVYFNSSSEEFVAANIEFRFVELFRKLLQCTHCFETPLELFQAQQIENPVINNAFWANVLNGNFKISETKNGGKPRPILIIVDEARGLKGVDESHHSRSSIYME